MIRRILTPKNLIGTSIIAAGTPNRHIASLTTRLGIYKFSSPEHQPVSDKLSTSQLGQSQSRTQSLSQDLNRSQSRSQSQSSKAPKASNANASSDSKMMRAIRVDKFGDEGNLKLVDKEVPTPKDNEVLLKVEAIGVNPVEVMIRTGMFGDLIKPPYVPGSDVAGVVEEVGSKVVKFRKGDRVFAVKTSSGAYAEYCTAPADYVSILNKNLTFSQGAAIGLPYTVAYKSLFIRANAEKGDTVLIHGASGAVGQAAVQMAKARGMTVIGTAGTPAGMELVKRVGADYVYNHRDTEYMDQVLKATGRRGVNVVLEMLANKNLVADLQVLAPRGKIVIIGSKGSIPEFNPSLAMGVEADILGMVVQVSTHDEYMVMLNAINQGQGNWLNPEIAKVYSLEETAQAHRDISNNKGSKGKLILKPAL